MHLVATSSRCTIDLQAHTITEIGDKYHIKVENGEDKIFTVEDMINCMYEKKCHAVSIKREFIPHQDKNIICGKLSYETKICGGRCESGSHPKFPRRDMCIACGPDKKNVKHHKKHITCADKNTLKNIQVEVKWTSYNGCSCNRYKCEPLLNHGLLRLF